MDDRDRVSVIVLTYNRAAMFRDCLDSLVRQTYPRDRFEIIVVDSSTTGAIRDLVSGYHLPEGPEIRYFYQEKQGIPAARNLGIQQASSGIVCFTDDDCIADPDWILNLTRAYTGPEIGGIAGKIVGYESRGIVERYGDLLFARDDPGEDGLLAPGEGPCCCNSSYRKEVLALVHSFDPRVLMNEDLEIALRIRDEGYRFRFTGDAVVRHRQRLTLGELLDRAYRLTMYGMKLISDKYPEEYPFARLLLGYLARIPYEIVRYPYVIVTAPFREDRLFHLATPLLDILVTSCRAAGCVSAVFHGVKYRAKAG
ncbi:MAG TPA: glycosyltransferase [Methanomicrobiales archaeon]|nr:glycosyltransferase [Methanomicrobiales archaeon]